MRIHESSLARQYRVWEEKVLMDLILVSVMMTELQGQSQSAVINEMRDSLIDNYA